MIKTDEMGVNRAAVTRVTGESAAGTPAAIRRRSCRWQACVSSCLAALCVLLFPLAALAGGTAGNAIVRNTVTVNYSDAYGVAQPQLTVSFNLTVSTVSATPNISFLPASASTDGSGSTATYTVRVISNSNGPRAVALSVQDFTAATNMKAASTSAPYGLPASVFLGATMVDPSDSHGTVASWPAGTSLTFNVPNDGGIPTDQAESGGAVNDGAVNGLKSGDTVYMVSGGSYFGPLQVGTVSDPAPGTGASVVPCTIQLTNTSGAAIGNLATAYAQIVEAKDATMTVTQGDVNDATQYSSWSTTVTATVSGAAATSGSTVTVSHMGSIAVAKYVRNASAAVVGSNPCPAVAINGTTYSAANGNAFYVAGVSGKPGDNLEYLTVVTNVGTGSSTGVNASDAIPAHLSLVTWGGSYGAGTGSTGTAGVFAHARLSTFETDMATAGTGSAAVGFGGLTAAGASLTFDLGSTSSWGTGGTLASGQSVYIIYQQRIN